MTISQIIPSSSKQQIEKKATCLFFAKKLHNIDVLCLIDHYIYYVQCKEFLNWSQLNLALNFK